MLKGTPNTPQNSTCLVSLPQARKGGIISAAGSILSGIWGFPQERIDWYKQVVYWAVTGQLKTPDAFTKVQDIIRAHREQIITLLSFEKCMSREDRQKSVAIIDELLWLDHTTIMGEKEDTLLSFPDGQEYTSILCKWKKMRFILNNNETVVVYPNRKGGWYTVQINSWWQSEECYGCHHYDVDISRGWNGWVTLYDNNGEIIWGYNFASIQTEK